MHDVSIRHMRQGERTTATGGAFCFVLAIALSRLDLPRTSHDNRLIGNGFVTAVTANKLTKLAVGEAEGLIYHIS